jgi:hypothetical protein
MTPLQTLLFTLGVVLTGEAIADFLASHQAMLVGLGCLSFFCIICYSTYRNRPQK